jgi:hypothetical protein
MPVPRIEITEFGEYGPAAWLQVLKMVAAE